MYARENALSLENTIFNDYVAEGVKRGLFSPLETISVDWIW